MVFSSLLFLFRFLPIVLFIYYAVPCCMNYLWKNMVLFLFSLFFYAWGEPIYIFLMLFSTIVDYINGGLTGYFIKRKKKGIARIFLVCSIIINLSLLGIFKYAGFFCEVMNQFFGISLPVKELALPIGISFYTFQTMSYTIDIYRKEAEPERNIIHFGAYVSLFPQLIAGPIVRFQEIAKQLRERKHSLEHISYGILRFITGLGKKVLLANSAGLVWTEVTKYSSLEMTTVAAWLGLLFYMFQIYFDFSGYSDMAIGLMAMFGFDIEENFKYPYTARSITEFWRKWHISLGTWFREYVYIPLGGNRKGKLRTYGNIFLVWFLTGLWHGASLNFICWGLYFCAFLIVEKCGFLKKLEKLPAWIGHGYVCLVVYFGWLIFAWQDIEGHRVFLKAMAGLGSAGFVNRQALYLFVTNFVLLIALILGSTELPKRSIAWICRKREGMEAILQTIFIITIFLLSTSYLVNASYNPFLYFRF